MKASREDTSWICLFLIMEFKPRLIEMNWSLKRFLSKRLGLNLPWERATNGSSLHPGSSSMTEGRSSLGKSHQETGLPRRSSVNWAMLLANWILMGRSILSNLRPHSKVWLKPQRNSKCSDILISDRFSSITPIYSLFTFHFIVLSALTGRSFQIPDFILSRFFNAPFS